MNSPGGINEDIEREDKSVSEIRESVGKYGGFYIAKYEAGVPLDNEGEEIIPTVSNIITDFTLKPRSVEDATPWNYISRDNCIIVSSNIVDSESGVKSSLIS